MVMQTRLPEILTASKTLKPTDSGKLFILNAADIVLTLPKADENGNAMRFTAVVNVPSAGAGAKLSPDAADVIVHKGITPAAGKDLINTGATDGQGDHCTVESDGSGRWYVTSSNGTWDREA